VVDLSSVVLLICIVIIFFTSIAFVESLKQTYKLSFSMWLLFILGMLLTPASSTIIIMEIIYPRAPSLLCIAYSVPVFIVGTIFLILGIRLSRKNR
jgi:hypothetical protein